MRLRRDPNVQKNRYVMFWLGIVFGAYWAVRIASTSLDSGIEYVYIFFLMLAAFVIFTAIDLMYADRRAARRRMEGDRRYDRSS